MYTRGDVPYKNSVVQTEKKTMLRERRDMEKEQRYTREFERTQTLIELNEKNKFERQAVLPKSSCTTIQEALQRQGIVDSN